MAKWIFTRPGSWDYPTLGFRATTGDVCEADLAPDAWWDATDSGATVTVPIVPTAGIQEDLDGAVLVYNASTNKDERKLPAVAGLLTEASADARFAAVVSIAQYVEAGESLVLDGSGVGDNTAIFQRAVDACSTAFLADSQPRKIYFPRGSRVRLAKAADHSYGGTDYPYCIRWLSGVGIATDAARDVTFYAPSDATPFFAAKDWGDLAHVYCDSHIVDGSAQTWGSYTTRLKGWFIQGLNHFRFDDIEVRDTWATGFGCDFLRDGKITGHAEGCGRGLVELSVDPLTTSGGSGFGIGTGAYEVEDFELDVTASNCGFHGVFTEWQVGEPYAFSKGSRIRAIVRGNYVGFRDCGSDGLQAEIVSIGNTYAGVLHGDTILAPTAGINGYTRLHSDGDGVGIRLGDGQAGPYTFSGKIMNATAEGVTTEDVAVLDRISLRDLDIHNCGARGLEIDKSSSNLDLHRVRAWDNTGGDIALTGAFNVAEGIAITECDFRSGGMLTDQLMSDAVIDRNRGLQTGSGGVADFADTFNRAAGTSLGSTEVGAAAWTNPSTAFEIGATGISLVAGTASGTYTATIDAGATDVAVAGRIGALLTGTGRRLRLVARYSDVNNFIRFGFSTTTNRYEITQVIAGSATQLATFDTGEGVGTWLVLEVTGTTVNAYRNGTLIMTATTSLTTGTRVGVQTTQGDVVSAFNRFLAYV